MDHSTKQTIADVAIKTIEIAAGAIITIFGGKKAYKELKKKKEK